MNEALKPARKVKRRSQIVAFSRAQVVAPEQLTPTAERLFAKCPKPAH